MAGSVSKELEDLLNPLPVFADPEDIDDEATKARVIESFAGEEEEEGGEEEKGPVRLSALRRRNVTLLADTDRRYVGKPVSREQLLKDLEGSGEEEEEKQDSLDEDEVDESRIDEDEEEEAGDDEHDDEKDITLPPGMDFRKLTEGMDDLGMSEDDLEGSDYEDEASDDDDDDDDDDDEMEEEGGVQTFSQDKVDEGVEKGKAVKNQLSLWDQLLEGRIKIQKALMTANQLPQPDTLPAFRSRGGSEMAGAMKTAHKALKALQRTLLELHDHLLYQNKELRAVAGGARSDDEEVVSDGEAGGSVPAARPPKRKLEMAEYPDVMAKRFEAFKPYCNDTLQKWHDKTRLTTGRSGSKGFGAFDRNILTQVEQVLTDKERLLRRTRTRRSEYRVLGKMDTPVVAEDLDADGQAKANQHLRDLDEDVFDDDDFYHQLLRELIERRTSASDPNDQVATGRQWLAIQKLRSKIKKKVDTKASKGRKVRFHVHDKMVNFMAPMDCGPMSDEARSELYRGLFGQSAPVRQ